MFLVTITDIIKIIINTDKGIISKINMLAKAGLVGRIASVTNFVYKTFFGDPNDTHKKVLPILKLAVNEYGRDSKEVQGLLELMGELAPVGAKRRNFIRKYITPLDGWLLLPSDPDKIPYVFWH